MNGTAPKHDSQWWANFFAFMAFLIAVIAFLMTVCNRNPKPMVIREKWEIRQQEGGMVEARKVSTEVMP